MLTGKRSFLKSLEGIRAYAFLMVFLVHFSGFKWTLTGRSILAYPFLIVLQLSFVAVPIFFALSGYLITGVLYDTLGREGYFRVFYLRRSIRVFPLYYATLGLGVIMAVVSAGNFHSAHLLYLVYLQNWNANPTLPIWGHYTHMFHLWSMAVEEQYYLLWPMAVWMLRGRRQLLTFCYTMIGMTIALRLALPLLQMTGYEAYQSTLFRCDPLMLGSALALHQRGPMRSLARLTKPAWAVVIGGLALMTARALLVGQALPYDRFGVEVVTPTIALVGAAIVVLAIEPGTVIFTMCEQSWAVALGKMSYSLYLMHGFLIPLWEIKVVPTLSTHLGHLAGRLVGMVSAFGLIYAASCLTYRFLELPGMRLKGRFLYDRPRGFVQGEGWIAFLRKVTS